MADDEWLSSDDEEVVEFDRIFALAQGEEQKESAEEYIQVIMAMDPQGNSLISQMEREAPLQGVTSALMRDRKEILAPEPDRAVEAGDSMLMDQLRQMIDSEGIATGMSEARRHAISQVMGYKGKLK